jgi:hypothetical protein
MDRPKAELVLSYEERAALEQMRRRASIVVLCSEGRDSIAVAEELSITPQTGQVAAAPRRPATRRSIRRTVGWKASHCD